MWTPTHKAAILPLYLLFTISWSLEMYVISPIHMPSSHPGNRGALETDDDNDAPDAAG